MSDDLPITTNLTIPGSELAWMALRSSGPGGQNVNKVSTKVELRFALAESESLPEAVKNRLRRIAGGRIDATGQLLIVCQQARSQPRNLKLARARLVELVRLALIEPKRRRATQPSAGAVRRRLESKRRTSERKQQRNWRAD